MTSAIDQTVSEVTAKLAEFHDKIAEIEAAAPTAARTAVDLSPGALFWDEATKADYAAQLQASLLDATDYAKSTVKPFEGYALGPGNPAELRDRADDWLEVVAPRISALVTDISVQALSLPAQDIASWDSDAREKYEEAQAEQIRMIDSLTAMTTTFENGLREIAGTIEAFWWSMVSFVVGLVVAVLGLVVAVLGGATGVLLALGIAIMIGGIVLALAPLIMSVVNGFTISADQQRQMSMATSGLVWTKTAFAAS